METEEFQETEVIFNQKEIDYNGGDQNLDFKDIFGYNHSFFRRYKINSEEYKVHSLPNGLCFPNQEIVFSKKRNIIINQTSYRIHPLAFCVGGGGYKKYFEKFLYLFKKNKNLFSFALS